MDQQMKTIDKVISQTLAYTFIAILFLGMLALMGLTLYGFILVWEVLFT